MHGKFQSFRRPRILYKAPHTFIVYQSNIHSLLLFKLKLATVFTHADCDHVSAFCRRWTTYTSQLASSEAFADYIGNSLGMEAEKAAFSCNSCARLVDYLHPVECECCGSLCSDALLWFVKCAVVGSCGRLLHWSFHELHILVVHWVYKRALDLQIHFLATSKSFVFGWIYSMLLVLLDYDEVSVHNHLLSSSSMWYCPQMRFSISCVTTKWVGIKMQIWNHLIYSCSV